MKKNWLLLLILCLTFLFCADETVVRAQESKKDGVTTQTDSGQSSASVKNPKLREELLKRMKADQEMRAEVRAKYPPGQALPEEIVSKWKSVDGENTEWMKKVIEENGFPGYSLVGKDGSTAAFLLVQHADQDHEFQKKVLELLKKAVDLKDANGSHLAYLTDRVLVAEGKPQRFGTQMRMNNGELEPSPIEDEANVDKRRAEIGLPTIADYIKMIKNSQQKKTGN